MEVWGIHAFENDDGLDWSYSFASQLNPLERFAQYLDVEGVDELDVAKCTDVLCSCVLIDALVNVRPRFLPKPAVLWLRAFHDLKVEHLVPPAILALDQLLKPNSALVAFWSSDEKLYRKWRRQIHTLRNRLRSRGGLMADNRRRALLCER